MRKICTGVVLWNAKTRLKLTRAATLMAVLAGACVKYGSLNQHNKLWQQSPKGVQATLGQKWLCLNLKFVLTYPPTVMLPFHMPTTGSYRFLSLSPLHFYPSVLSWHEEVIGKSANEFGHVCILHILPVKVGFSKRCNWGTSSINLLPLLSISADPRNTQANQAVPVCSQLLALQFKLR